MDLPGQGSALGLVAAGAWIPAAFLDTDVAALALFRSEGFEEIPDYNGDTFAKYWFRKDLT